MDGPNDPEPSLVVEDGRVVEIDGRGEARLRRPRLVPRAQGDRPRSSRGGGDAGRRRRSPAGSSTSTARATSCPPGSRGLTPARLVPDRVRPRPGRGDVRTQEAPRAPRAGEPGPRHESQGEPGAARRRCGRGGRARVRRARDDGRRLTLRTAERDRAARRLVRWGARRDDPVRRSRSGGIFQLAIQGLVTYAETLSVYGTEPVFVDGDDTPWSKAFLALGVRVARREGALHLGLSLGGPDGGTRRASRCSISEPAASLPCARPARRAYRTGRSPASRSCSRCPAGTKEILAENLLAAWLDLEARLRQRRDRLPLGDPEDGEADGPSCCRARTSSPPATR